MRERKRMKHETHAKKTKFTARLKGQSPSCHLKENGGVYSGKVYFWVVAKDFWLVVGGC